MPDISFRRKDAPWLIALVLSLFFLGYGLLRYELLDGNDPMLMRTFVVAFPILTAVFAFFRRSLFPWARRSPVMMWFSVLNFGVFFAMGIIGIVLTANGAFDRGPSSARRFVVTFKEEIHNRGRTDQYYMLRPENSPGAKPIKLEIGVRERLDAPIGGVIVLDVMPGYLGRPWVKGHQVLQHDQVVPPPGAWSR